MRDIKKLLSLLLDYVPYTMIENNYCSGLCSVIGRMLNTEMIIYDEARDLNNFVATYMPKDYTTGFSSPGVWGWKPQDAKSRIEWLNAQINSL